MWHLFKTPTAREVAVQQLAEAERLALEHRAAAESHASTANMLDARAARLREFLRPPVFVAPPCPERPAS